ncbi:MAG: CPBP family intramembrane metalloprotease [Caldilineaceae bacterium]|nr:CPBP family intramembrane metalloprotease [Caldilineaceae bacterium]
MHSLLWPIWNGAEGRVRAGWRILIHLGLFLFAPPLLNQAVGPAISRTIAYLAPDLALLSDRLTLAALRLLAVLVSTALVVYWVDRRPWRDLGLHMGRAWWIDLAFGLVLGAVLMTFVFVVQYVAGWVEVREFFAVELVDTPFVIAILGPLAVFVVVGITEELLSRGYQLRNLAEGLNMRWWGPRPAIIAAWVVSSSLFGLLHIFNPNATWISTVYLMLAGLFLGLGYVLTGRLGLPIGLHITWNFFQGNIYGFPVSGNTFSSVTVIAIRQGGPALWTGGAFGPEAGLIGIVAILLGCLLTLAWVRVCEGRLQFYLPLACYRPRRAARAGGSPPNAAAPRPDGG